MKDNYDDKVTVHQAGDEVILHCEELNRLNRTEVMVTEMSLTPAMAKRLARKLEKVARRLDAGV